MSTIQHTGLKQAAMEMEGLAGVVELQGSVTSPTSSTVATQTDNLWPVSVWGESERATASPVSEREEGRWKASRKKTRRLSAASSCIFTGMFRRSRWASQAILEKGCSS